jgi:(p)ppGpp synthase/HD superfamily hydrolase
VNPSSETLQANIDLAILAHSRYARQPSKAIRYWDQRTPYAIHPIWCAMTLLTETTLPQALRSDGYQALHWHDVVEDTEFPLPQDVGEEVTRLVAAMSFDDQADEMAHVWERGDTVILLKLYDKVSNLLDGTWMSDERWNAYVSYTERLRDHVRLAFGELNIVRIAEAFCVRRA